MDWKQENFSSIIVQNQGEISYGTYENSSAFMPMTLVRGRFRLCARERNFANFLICLIWLLTDHASASEEENSGDDEDFSPEDAKAVSKKGKRKAVRSVDTNPR